MKYIIHLFILTIIATACTKYQELADANYPEQIIYMSTAGSIYPVSKNPPGTWEVPTQGNPYRFRVDSNANQVIIPLGVLRGGIDYNGIVAVEIKNNTDTVNTLISQGALSAELLPASAYSIPTSVTLPDKQNSAAFDVVIDRNFLQHHIGTSYALGVSIASKDRKTNPDKETTIVVIDANILTD